MSTDAQAGGGVTAVPFRSIDATGFAALARPPECGAVPDLRWLPIDRLVVDPTYQRDVAGSGRTNVRRIAERFAWSKFSPVVVSPVIGGAYAIIDGQHRTTAAALLGFGEVPCQIVVADRRQQAEAFSAINGGTTRMTGLALFAARVASGEPDAVAIQEACAGCGVEILRYPVGIAYMKPGQTLATGAIQGVYTRLGRPVLVTTLKAIQESANGEEPGALRDAIIRALAEVLAGNVAWLNAGGKLIEALDDLDLDDLLRDAAIEAHRRPGVTAGVLLEAKLVDAFEKALG